MFKYLRVVTTEGWRIINNHLAYILRFARHPGKYPYSLRYEKTRDVIQKVLRSFHVDYLVEGLEKFLDCPGKVCLVSNHYSIGDPLAVIAVSKRPINFVAKIESFSYPFVKSYLKALQTIPLDRQRIGSQALAMARAVRMIGSPEEPDFLIYGEGTRNKEPSGPILPLKPGTFKVAYKAKATIIPVAIYGTFRIFDRKCDLKRIPVQIKFFDPIRPEDYEDVPTVDLAPKVEKAMNEEILRMKRKDIDYILGLKMKAVKKAAAIAVDLPPEK